MSDVESYHYEWDLSEARRFLADGELVSVKVRPIESLESRHNRYVYPAEYDNIRVQLGEYPVVWNGPVNSGQAEIYDIHGYSVILVEHETGPEIIVYLHLLQQAAMGIGGAAVAGQQVVKLINMICETIRKEAHSKNTGKPSDRHYGAGALSIESRIKSAGKILKLIAITSKSAGTALKDVSEIIPQ